MTIRPLKLLKTNNHIGEYHLISVLYLDIRYADQCIENAL